MFKVMLSPSKKNCVICFFEHPVNIMKNAFYFILKALFVLNIFKGTIHPYYYLMKNNFF